MKKPLFLFIACLSLFLISCDKTHVIDEGLVASDIVFEPEEFDVHVTPETDVVPFEYSRLLPNPDFVQWKSRHLVESPDSEAKHGIHYTVDTSVYGSEFFVYFEPDEPRGRYEGLHIIPSAIDRNMKLIIMNYVGDRETLTINLIVNEE